MSELKPKMCIRDSRDTWEDKAAYDAQAKKLAKMFQDNFTKKYPNMPKTVSYTHLDVYKRQLPENLHSYQL